MPLNAFSTHALACRTVSKSKTVFSSWAARIQANVSTSSYLPGLVRLASLPARPHTRPPSRLPTCSNHFHHVIAVQNTASLMNAFQHWQKYWGWQYDTPKALAAAFQNWQHSLLKVHATLSQLGDATDPNAYLPGLTKLSDVSYADFIKYYTGLRHHAAKPRSRLVVTVAFKYFSFQVCVLVGLSAPDAENRCRCQWLPCRNGTAVEISPAARRRLLASTPAAIDWAALGKVTRTRDQVCRANVAWLQGAVCRCYSTSLPIQVGPPHHGFHDLMHRVQGQCGSCYAFSGTAAIESRMLIQKGLLASKTPQLALARQESVREKLHSSGICGGVPLISALLSSACVPCPSHRRYRAARWHQDAIVGDSPGRLRQARV